MDILENILEHIAARQEQRDGLLKQAETEEQTIGKLEAMYSACSKIRPRRR